MRIRKVILFFGIMVLLSACFPDPLPIDGIPQLDSKIVVSTQIDGDQTVLLLLTKSVGALDASDDSDLEALLNEIAINDAVVIISTNEFSDTLDFIDSGLYISATIPLETGVEYSLEVKSPTMGTVTSSTFLNPRVSFEYVEARLYNDGYDTLAEVIYGFNDPAEKNFYMFNVQRLTQEYEAEDLLNPEVFTQLIDDETFETSSYSDSQQVSASRDFMPGDTIAIFLSNISEEYYDFMQLRLDSRFSFAEYLAEPANYPSNINGGLGFFNLYIPDVRIAELQ